MNRADCRAMQRMEVVLTGIRPEVAQTVVGLGVELRGITTRSSLHSGLAYALGLTSQR